MLHYFIRRLKKRKFTLDINIFSSCLQLQMQGVQGVEKSDRKLSSVNGSMVPITVVVAIDS